MKRPSAIFLVRGRFVNRPYKSTDRGDAMKKVIKYGVLIVLIVWFLVNLIPNFLTVRVNVSSNSWSFWTAPDYVPETDKPKSTEPQWTEYALRCGDRVEIDGFYDISFVVKDIDLFSITIKCEPQLSGKTESGTHSLGYGRTYFKIPKSEVVKLTTTTMDAGQTLKIEFLGFQ